MAVRKPTKKPPRARNPRNADADGCFEITLARTLAGKRKKKRFQIPEAISQHGSQLSQLDAHKRVELAAALQWEFRRRASWVKDDNRSLQTLQHKYKQVRDFVTPIYRLPIEVLTEVFTIDFENNQSPSRLTLVCRDWYRIVEGMASMWQSLKLGTWTAPDRVERFMQKAWWMNVVIDTEEDMERSEGEGEGYIALALVLANASRWRRLTIESSPHGIPVPSSVVIPPISGIESIRVASRAQPSPLLDRILENIGTAAAGSLSMMETTSYHTIRHLLQPEYVQLFHYLTTLKADTRTTPDSVDLLPHLLRIEDLDLSNVSLPPYTDDVDLPLVHSLRHLRLKVVSIQWMGGRKFTQLQSCSIHSPTTYPPTSSDVYLPICQELEFGHLNAEVAGRFQAPKVDSVTMKSNEWTPLRGSQQVILLCRAGLGFHWQPRVLHLSVLCDEGLLLSALKLLPALNELQLDIARPCVLGRRFFKALLAKPIYEPKGKFDRNWGEAHPQHVKYWKSSICPSLKKLVLKYERWLRSTDQLDILPPLMAIGWSRRGTTTPLKSFHLRFERSDTMWEVFRLYSLDMLDFAARDIPQLRPFEGFSSFLKSCITATATSVMVHSGKLPDLQHTLPIFKPYFSRLRVLNISNPMHTQLTFDILSNFLQLEELELESVNIPSYSTKTGLPSSQTLLRLFLGAMTLTWMDGFVFTRLKRLYLHRVALGEPLSIGLPVCTHIKYVGENHCPLQSIFRVPTLIEFVHEYDPFLGSNNGLRLLPTRSLFLRCYPDTTPESLIAGIVPLVELDVLSIEIDQRHHALSLVLSDWWANAENPVMALLTALGRSNADVGVPALPSAYVTFERNAVDDEYGEDAGTLSRGPRSLICPNLRQLALRIWGARDSGREEIGRKCKQMVDNRRRAGQELECCRIWWGGDTTASIIFGTSGDSFQMK